MKKIFNTTLIKRDGKLEHTIQAKEALLDELIKDLPVGMKGSNAQLAKIHAMLRQLASDIGEETATLKEQIKEEAMIDKSFADCDTDELNDVIQTILKIGDWSGSNLR